MKKRRRRDRRDRRKPWQKRKQKRGDERRELCTLRESKGHYRGIAVKLPLPFFFNSILYFIFFLSLIRKKIRVFISVKYSFFFVFISAFTFTSTVSSIIKIKVYILSRFIDSQANKLKRRKEIETSHYNVK